MVIRVIYDDGTFDMIKATRLDDLLPTGRIAKFKRSNGWVTVGVDPVRMARTGMYAGLERRLVGSSKAA